MDPIALRYKRRAERYPDENEEERWNGVALDCYLRTGHVPKEVLYYKAIARAGLLARKYREDQPRVPAGNPDGGQWTDDGGSSGSVDGEEVDGGGGGDDNLPIEPASLRDKARAVGRAVGALRNWWRGERSPKPYDARKDPLTPNGELVGKPGSREKIRTLEPKDFDELKGRMLEGSQRLPENPRYDGSLFQRPDGTQFGIRKSKEWGETIDVFKSPNSKIKPGTKVHQLWPSI